MKGSETWSEYHVQCLRGAITNTTFRIEVWAKSRLHAKEICREHGYMPLAISYAPMLAASISKEREGA